MLVVVADVTDARRLDAVRRDFVANASHELKTPAASIQAAAETLLHVWHEDPEAVPRFAEQLEREAVRLSRIVADLLDLSRLESGSELQDIVHMDVLIREESSRFEEAAIEAGLTMDVDAAPVPAVRGSGRDLSLLVRNLLDNAIRYTKEAGRVVASVSADNGAVVLRVTDTGTGIPSTALPRVFERFYRVDRARSRETGGTGLGLAIVRHVAENHGGTVTVKSELGRGSTFEVRLPSASSGGTEAAGP
jgi:signal transduction histidine kinase